MVILNAFEILNAFYSILNAFEINLTVPPVPPVPPVKNF